MIFEGAIAAFMIAVAVGVGFVIRRLRDISDVTLFVRAIEARVEGDLLAITKEVQKLKETMTEISNEIEILRLRSSEAKQEVVKEGSLGVADIERAVKLAMTKVISEIATPHRGIRVVPKSVPLTVDKRIQGRLSLTEMKVLDLLDEPRTYRDVVKILGVTREHAARILKRLHELGYVERDTSKRPYTYVRVKT